MLLKERHDFEAETMPLLDEVGKALQKAAEIIRKRGWKQCGYGFGGGPVCLRGAIWATSNNEKTETTFEALDYMAALGKSITWNDTEGRTADEVIAALESAALTRARSLLDRSA